MKVSPGGPSAAAASSMQTAHSPRPSSTRQRASLCALLLGALLHAAAAQTLAQKNWAGSGVSVEPWWRHGVLYRIDPARFQDANSQPPAYGAAESADTAHGDLAGIAQRLDYIQSLGVDAILLAPAAGAPPLTPGDPGWDGLARAATDRHVRLLVTLPAPASQAAASDAKVLAVARAWLNQGVAGLYIPTRAIAQVDGGEHVAALLRQLHALAASFPGERILVAEAPPAHPDPALAHGLAVSVQLTASPALELSQPTAASLRSQLAAALAAPAPLLLAERVPAQAGPAQQAALDRTVAMLLLASRGAVLLDYGQELGLLPAPGAAMPPLMQWTPGNRTKPAPPPPPPPPPPAPPDESFKPYVPPLPRNLFPPPPMPEVEAVEHPINPLLDPDALPGFSAAALPPSASRNGATANVVLEDADPASLLSFYRRLIQLHHDNGALRDGTQTQLDRDAPGALLWLRTAPANARTVGNAVVVCNLSAQPLTLSLDALHLRATGLRTLLGAEPARTANTLTLAPYSVFLGEAAR
jgi:alpha-glucosidase